MHQGCSGYDKIIVNEFQGTSKLEAMSLVQENEEFYDALCSPTSDNGSLKSFDSDTGKQFLPCNNSVDSESSKSCMCSGDCECDLSNGDYIMPTSSSALSINQSGSRRRSLVPPKAEHGFSLWSLVKHCMGKDLTKIPLPVYFNEPLSTLQRLTEEYEYASLLTKASECENSCEQIVYVATFIISSYSSSSNRTGKPFNPLLGETFECDRMEDLGWKCISEQVSHHPPVMAQYCEGPGWTAWQEFSMTTKLKGASLLVNPQGLNHLLFKNTGHHYTWNKVSTTVHNLVIGTLWVDHHGELKIKNHTTGDECVVHFMPYKCFSSETYRKVTGVAKDRHSIPQWMLEGTWDKKIKLAQVISGENPQIKTTHSKLVWKRNNSKGETDKYYNMTRLACQLNEPEDGVAPTDSRLRPDQRQMENGLWDEANTIKVQLEEKQRHREKRHMELKEKAIKNGEPYREYTPTWFKLEKDLVTNELMHVYTGEYWESKHRGDWSKCPEIFL